LVLFGARLSLSFAETFWEPRVGANTFWEQAWVGEQPRNLAAFAAQVTRYIQAHRARKCPYPMLGLGLDESDWLRSYSPRHRRRMYLSVFGVSRQAMERVRGVHIFLEQLCDFERRMPRILGHVDPDVFYDQPHLNRVFKKMTGLAPLEYFGTPAPLQDNLMAASYNALAGKQDML
jgi:AraC-like DNA-binding protein